MYKRILLVYSLPELRAVHNNTENQHIAYRLLQRLCKHHGLIWSWRSLIILGNQNMQYEIPNNW